MGHGRIKAVPGVQGAARQVAARSGTPIRWAAGKDSVRHLTPELLDSAARLLAEAFFTNPAHTYICPDASKRPRQLMWLLGGNLRLQPDLRASFCLAEGQVVHAMGFWTRSTAPKIGTLRKMRAGLLSAPRYLGWAGVSRLFEVTREIDRHLDQALGDRPYWYLNNMVVREGLRGSGIGTRLLRQQLPLVAKMEPAYSIALLTQRRENVTFYQRLGFQPVLEQTIGSEPGAFRSWIMVCPPRAKQGAAADRQELCSNRPLVPSGSNSGAPFGLASAVLADSGAPGPLGGSRRK